MLTTNVFEKKFVLFKEGEGAEQPNEGNQGPENYYGYDENDKD